LTPTTLIRPDDLDAIAAVDARELEHPSIDWLRVLEPADARAADQPLKQRCSGRYKARRVSGRRPLAVIDWIVLHSTEGPSAAGAAAWFANDLSRGSAHLAVDDRECYRTLDAAQIPWGAPGANYRGFHIEMAGYARWTALIWSRQHRRTLSRAAYKAALHCRKYGIPPTFRTAAQLRRGEPGVTTHNECSKAFGGTHWDPGPGWPRLAFMSALRWHYKRLADIEPVTL
jgi:hypothetical protein